MTTYFNFQPSSNGPFQFQPILDGVSYTGIVTWNTFGQRWYLNLYDGSGNLISCKALIGSTDGLAVQSLDWDSGIVTLTTDMPHGFIVGETINLNLAAALPDAYNGLWEMLVTGPSSLTFSLGGNPGVATSFGIVSYDIDLILGYGLTSTLVFRQSSQNFETNP